MLRTRALQWPYVGFHIGPIFASHFPHLGPLFAPYLPHICPHIAPILAPHWPHIGPTKKERGTHLQNRLTPHEAPRASDYYSWAVLVAAVVAVAAVAVAAVVAVVAVAVVAAAGDGVDHAGLQVELEGMYRERMHAVAGTCCRTPAPNYRGDRLTPFLFLRIGQEENQLYKMTLGIVRRGGGGWHSCSHHL